MSHGAVAERYAQAIFELGEESGGLAAVSQKLSDFAATYAANRELSQALNNPVMSPDERRSLIAAVAKKIGVPEIGVQSLYVMAQRGRLPFLEATAARLRELCDDKNGVIRAHVTTATAMSESYYQSLQKQLEAVTKKKVVLEKSTDATLVGGAIAQVGDTVIDSSVRGQLEKVERELLTAIAAGAS